MHISFFNITLWPGRADGMKKLLRKGSVVIITGQYYQHQYVSKEGQEKQTNGINMHSIVFPVCDHPLETSTETEYLDDQPVNPLKHDLTTDEKKLQKKEELKS
eukprot:NODE_12_length_54577_cov_0.384100.p31 type:complete len:103 gc:universal NODE_12_length_54577_cov_0.384100:50407-50099(-)